MTTDDYGYIYLDGKSFDSREAEIHYLNNKHGRPTKEEADRRFALGIMPKAKRSKPSKFKKYVKKVLDGAKEKTSDIDNINYGSTACHWLPNTIQYREDKKTEPLTRFTVKEILDIIKAGNESNLSDFRYMGLVLSFKGLVAKPIQPKPLPKTSESQTQEQSSTEELQPDKPLIQGWDQKADAEMIAEENLMVEDPLAYEQAMIDKMNGPTEDAEREIRRRT